MLKDILKTVPENFWEKEKQKSLNRRIKAASSSKRTEIIWRLNSCISNYFSVWIEKKRMFITGIKRAFTNKWKPIQITIIRSFL